jgi:hypothetical protein
MAVEQMQPGGVRFDPGNMFAGELVPGVPEENHPCLACSEPIQVGQVFIYWVGPVAVAWHIGCAMSWLPAFTKDIARAHQLTAEAKA